MSFPRNAIFYRKNIPDHTPINKDNNQGQCHEPIIFGQNALKKNKTGQKIDNPAGTDMVRWTGNEPSEQTWEQGTE